MTSVIFAKAPTKYIREQSSNLDVWQCSEYACDDDDKEINDKKKKLMPLISFISRDLFK